MPQDEGKEESPKCIFQQCGQAGMLGAKKQSRYAQCKHRQDAPGPPGFSLNYALRFFILCFKKPCREEEIIYLCRQLGVASGNPFFSLLLTANSH